MGDKTGIEWTNASWNPVVGCSLASPGCTNCYAMSMAARIEKMTPNSHYAGLTQETKAGPVWTGEVRLAPDHILNAPLRWRRPRLIFVNSMGDLFHSGVRREWIESTFEVMAQCARHTFQVLTKRMDRAAAYCRSSEPLPNVIIGPSIEDQKRADERFEDTKAISRLGWKTMASCEPLLGSLDLSRYLAVEQIELSIGKHWTERTGEVSILDWVIVGGESGPNTRPIQPDWARSIRDQCVAAGVPYFFKQWGGVSKRTAGCELDGKEWKQMPTHQGM